MFRLLIKRLTRFAVRCFFCLASKERQIRAERWIRGHNEVNKLKASDCVVVSFGKSGRTWLRVMLSRFYQVKHGLSERHLMGFDNLHRKNRQIPVICFTHDNYIKDYTGNVDNKSDFYDKKVILLVRDPRDIAVSQLFQWQHRMRPNKKELNDYPPHGAEISPYDFIMHEGAGLPKIIDFLNLWQKERPRIPHFLLVRYEDMRSNPERELARILEFVGTPGTYDQVKAAVEFAAFDNMKKMEQKRTFWLSGGRMVPKDRSNPNSFKVRRAKVGGYRDYFSEEEANKINAFVENHLDKNYGYAEAAMKDSAASA